MATRFIDANFRKQIIPGESGAVVPFNVADPGNADPWTVGATIIENVEMQAPLGQVWSLIGWSITLTAFLWANATGAAGPTTLGKIIGGLTYTKATPTINTPSALGPPFQRPWHEPMVPIPANTFGLTEIWDGTDPNAPPLVTVPNVPDPPTFDELGGTAPIITNYALPVPIQIYAGERMQMGLWITPTLNPGSLLRITGATYTVVVDDGQPQITTWGRDLATELAH